MMFSVARRLTPLSARVTAILAALAVCAAALVWAHSSTASAGPGSAGRRVEVIIQLSPHATASEGRALVRALGGQPGLDLHIIHGLSARMTAAAAARLARSPLVRVVSLNAPVQESTTVNFSPSKLATNFDQSVQATNMWNHSTGAGVGVAVIDTGIAGNVPDFQISRDNTASRVTASVVVDPGAGTATDTFGHGTLVAGLVGGDGGYLPLSDPAWGQYAGTAPNANLISIKISDDNGNASTLDAIYGLQFAVDHKSDYNIRVVNLSFRSTTAQSYQTDPLDAAAEQAWFAGIVVVAAAGNLGTASDAVDYAPANDPYVITVGAVDEQGTPNPTDDVQTSWSSRGTTQDGFTKPDILAPGAHIVSTLAPGSAFANLCPGCVTGNGEYFQASGTSLAAPIVAGAAADLLAIHPWWTPSMVKGAIVSGGTPIADGHELNLMGAYGAGDSQRVSDQGLTPNSLIDPNTGAINYGNANWTSGSWSVAGSALSASWSSASWSCGNCPSSSSGSVSTSSGSWSSGSWSTVGWATYWG